MKKSYLLILFLATAPLGIQHTQAQQKTFTVGSFNEVIISPHIEVIFEKADKESVVIEKIDVSMDKLIVEVQGKTLHVYLDDAKVYTKSEKVKYDDYKGKHAVYNGTIVSAKIYYKDLEEISLRGDETHKVESLLEGEELSVKIYGESEVYLSEIQVDEFQATLYGECYLEVKNGVANRQRIISYGEGEVNTFGVQNTTAKVTAYGEGRIKLSVSDELRVTAYGEASVNYKGSPMVSRGLVLGEATIHQVK
ncbi:head GIN domain-containing protein [Lutimonas vermicola]|uniref:Head GIN domain-containing protein n=1 Tax=Lutimonas vermicola TaxID=414288 RepID=A0ABU9L017_9FLAO